MRKNTQIAIKSAGGTIYFIEDSGGLKQGFDLVIENRGPAADAELTVQWDNNEYVCSSGTIDRGESTARVYIPDVRRPAQMTFTITSSGKTSQLTIDHNPQRHWTVHIVQFSHHDLGYTDLPTNVLREFCTFYDDAPVSYTHLTLPTTPYV